MYNRKAFKQEAKQMIRASVPHFMLITLVYYLLTAGLSTLVDWLTNTFSLPYGGGVLGLFLTILVGLFSLVMGIGFTNYSLRLARGEENGWNSLFHPFSYSGRAMGLPLLIMLYSFLWGLLIMVAAIVLVVILTVPTIYHPSFWPVTLVGAIAVYAGEIAVLLFIFLRYAMAQYVLVDDPDIGVLEAIRRSIRMLRGYKGKLFVLRLSFLGWELLVGLIAAAVIIIGLFASGSVQLLKPLTVAVMSMEDSLAIYNTIYSLTYHIISRMFLWLLLAELLSLPLNLWLMAYEQTAMARFYNYVGGYDYHQFMISQQPQTPPPSAAPPVWPAPDPVQPAPPPIGGYYTPQPDVSDPPEIPALPQDPAPIAPSAAEPAPESAASPAPVSEEAPAEPSEASSDTEASHGSDVSNEEQEEEI